MIRKFSLSLSEPATTREGRDEEKYLRPPHSTAQHRVLIIGFHGLRAAHYCFSHENIVTFCCARVYVWVFICTTLAQEVVTL